MNEPLPALALSSAYRYAIYFAPGLDDPLWRAGSQWLGRDAFTGARHEQPPLSGLTVAAQQHLTAAPRRYGWHATLKAPFALEATADLQRLRLALRELCRGANPFVLPRLGVTLLDDFLALVPTETSTDLDRIARACVSQLHTLAAPLSPADLARRRTAKLSVTEDEMLVTWGYPYVMDHFRFHMSLSGSLAGVSATTIDMLVNAASEWFAALSSCEFSSLALFAEPTSGADFVLLEHVPLGAHCE